MINLLATFMSARYVACRGGLASFSPNDCAWRRTHLERGISSFLAVKLTNQPLSRTRSLMIALTVKGLRLSFALYMSPQSHNITSLINHFFFSFCFFNIISNFINRLPKEKLLNVFLEDYQFIKILSRLIKISIKLFFLNKN